MRALVFLGFISMACSQHSGYNYQQQQQQHQQQQQQQQLQQQQQESGSSPSASNNDLLLQSLAPDSSQTRQQGASIQSVPLNEEFQKEFFSYAAPEDQFNDEVGNQNILNSQKQNLRVLFIRTSENKALENAALSLAKQASDQKTAIYVLQKQADIGSLAQRLQVIKQQTDNRPEVHFVKYRTQQDAINAQQAIQAQFDSLPGSSHSSNEGTAPVLNFASQAPAQPVSIPAGPGTQYLPQHPVPNQEYLPASLRRYRLK